MQGLTTETTLSSENYLRSLWGLLASQILNDKFEEAYETHVRLRDTIEKFEFARTVDQFNQRVWLANWSLFFFFSIENGPQKCGEVLLSEPYLNAMKIGSKHLIRYLIVALVLSDNADILRERVVEVN